MRMMRWVCMVTVGGERGDLCIERRSGVVQRRDGVVVTDRSIHAEAGKASGRRMKRLMEKGNEVGGEKKDGTGLGARGFAR
jgi:hypothetical protein